MNPISKWLIVFGMVLIGTGLIFPWLAKAPWIGRMPGDFFIRRGNLTFYFPLATSLLISVVVTLILSVLGKK